MSSFSYQAIDESGSRVSGTIEAESVQSASALLASRGLIPSRVTEEKAGFRLSSARGTRSRKGSVKPAELILFTKQFRSMFRAGIPLMRLLEVIAAQTQNSTLKSALEIMSQDIKQGSTISDAMEKFPSIFSPLYQSMIRAAEASGNISDVLDRLIYIIDHEAKIRSDIKSALQYPIMVLVALVGAFFFLLTFVIPNFVSLFSRAGMTLPVPTQIAMNLYKFLSSYWYVLIGGAVLLFFTLRTYLRTEAGKYVRDELFLRIPVIGELFQKAAMSRFASIFSILQASGVPIMDTMRILSGTIGNRAIASEFDRVRDRIKEGQRISATLQSAKHFTPMVIDMIAVGEESGNLNEMLREIYIHYDDEVGFTVKRLSEVIGPVLVVCLAAVVGFFALAIFMPMWDMTKMAH
jgi:type II secretory pathway component PulF